jgi:integrase
VQQRLSVHRRFSRCVGRTFSGREERIRISKRWAKGEDGETKAEASDAYVPLHPVLAERLQSWHLRSPHSQQEDFVFPSLRENSRILLCASTFVADYLRPAAIDAGVSVEKGKRFGLHNFRHSLSTFLVQLKNSGQDRAGFTPTCKRQDDAQSVHAGR